MYEPLGKLPQPTIPFWLLLELKAEIHVLVHQLKPSFFLVVTRGCK